MTRLDDVYVRRSVLDRIKRMNQTRLFWLRYKHAILSCACREASRLRFPVMSMKRVQLPRRTAEEPGTFRVEDASGSVPMFPSCTPDDLVRRRVEATLRVEDIRQETAERLLAAGLGLIPWQSPRKP